MRKHIYEGFREVLVIYKYFDEISVSVVCSVCLPCHYCIGGIDSFVWGFRFSPILFAVLQFWMNFSSVLRFLVYPNVPLIIHHTVKELSIH